METYRLKRIVLIVLVLVNLSLLYVLRSNDLQGHRRQENEYAQLRELYAAHGIDLRTERSAPTETADSATVIRSDAAERNFVAAFLGDALLCREEGSATDYTAPDGGTARLRRNGSLTLSCETPTMDAETARDVLADFGYVLGTSVSADGSYTAARVIEGRTVLGADLTLAFGEKGLTRIEGYYVNSIQEGEQLTSASPTDALARFLRFVLENKLSCQSVEDIRPAWLFSSATLFQSSLSPAWLIFADGEQYYVNVLTQEVAPVTPSADTGI